MENIGIVIFAVAIVGMILFVTYKRKKDAERREASNREWEKVQEAEWAKSDLNPNSPNFDPKKFAELQEKISKGEIRLP